MSIRGICTGTVDNIIIGVAIFLATILATLVNWVFARGVYVRRPLKRLIRRRAALPLAMDANSACRCGPKAKRSAYIELERRTKP